MSLLPPKWPISTPITKAPASLWDKCIVAIPMWQTVPRNVVEGAFTTTFGNPALVPTPVGYGLDFVGLDKALSFPAAFTSSKISVSFMFRRMLAASSTETLFELTPNFNSTNRTFSIFLLSTGRIQVNIHDTSARYLLTDYALPPVGEMAFCTATFEHNQSGNTGTVRLWVNGVESVGTVVKNDTFVQNGPFTTSTVYIAARAGNMLEAQVQFSSVMVHDRLLADAEIKLLHADPFQMFAPDTAAISGLVGDAPAAAGDVTGTASGTISLDGAATGTVAVSGTASGTISLDGAATGEALATGQASGTISLDGAATGEALATGQASGTVPLTGTATGTVDVQGAASGTIPLTGGATGTTEGATTGTAAGVIPLTGAATGEVLVTGTAAGTIPLTGAATGTTEGAATGEASGTIPLTGTATGTVAVSGAASGTIPLTGFASGGVFVTGEASGTIPLTGTATGTVGVETIEYTVPGTWRAHVVAGKWRSA